MARRRLPADSRFPAIATDWSTQDVESDVTFRKGQWWDTYIYEHHSQGRHVAYDRRKRARNLALKRFLSVQTADPGL